MEVETNNKKTEREAELWLSWKSNFKNLQNKKIKLIAFYTSTV